LEIDRVVDATALNHLIRDRKRSLNWSQERRVQLSQLAPGRQVKHCLVEIVEAEEVTTRVTQRA